ncbi:DUF421 domain-containing protein [Sphingopyxis sp. PAMC25046]|uniref:DUF421 domain-containing protein n=1 Tax=Sphingopyxis sp. PAMC25046 TaxID=2565556 RepID=UPI00109DCCFE|nr:DUF421 domain-containing protein [Sphingopyxis sp. PAMC25046]QCB55733.1 DUF421 domain-containing protein [Sphingopyxis sp. PAMC25046]
MDIVLRATAMFVFLYVLIRLLGKRELGQMTPFELVLLIVMGDLIQQGVTHNDFSLTGGLLAISTFAFWALLLSWATYRFPRLEALLDGSPKIIVKKGEIIARNLRRDRLTRDEILSEMRLAGIARLSDVEWAILEPQGKISFLARGTNAAKQQDDDDAV